MTTLTTDDLCDHFREEAVNTDQRTDDVAYCHEHNRWAFYSQDFGWVLCSGACGKRMSLTNRVFLLTDMPSLYLGGPQARDRVYFPGSAGQYR